MRTSALLPIALLAALIASACSDASAPAERIAAPGAEPLRSIQVSGPEDVPLEPSEEMPAAFYESTEIQGTSLEVDFAPGFAYAIAAMEYFATHGNVDVLLKLKGEDGRVLDSDTGIDSEESLLPKRTRLVARAMVSTPKECGLTADAKATYHVWMGFPLPRTLQFFTWGHRTTSLPKVKPQPECPPVEDFWTFIGMTLQSGGGGSGDDGTSDDQSDYGWSDDPYEGGCILCQEWIAIINGEPVYAWWECSFEDYSVCAEYGLY
jgi:hypothetical protein